MTSTASEDDDNWFYGKITSGEANIILNEHGGEEGTFLVRESNSLAGNYVLSVMTKDQPIHHLICRYLNDAFFYLMEDERQQIFHGLDTLVSHYMTEPLIPSIGLLLKKPCLGEPLPQDARLHGSSNLLHRAVSQGNLLVVTELLSAGYRKIDARNNSGQTALHIASINGNEEIVNLLLKANANCLVRDQDGLTPLHHACRFNQANVVKLLVNSGNADLQGRSAGEECVALHEAAQIGSIECINSILDLGAPAHPRNALNQTPAELAKLNNHIECYEILVSSQAPKPKFDTSMYFHGQLSRREVESLFEELNDKDKCSFVVRNSQKSCYYFVLSVGYQNQVYHFQILRLEDFYFIDNGPYFRDIPSLVDHYTRFRDGLPHYLEIPIEPKNPPEESLALIVANMPKHISKSANASSSDLQPLLSLTRSNEELLGSMSHSGFSLDTLNQAPYGKINEIKQTPYGQINQTSKSNPNLTTNESFDLIDLNYIPPEELLNNNEQDNVGQSDWSLNGNKTNEVFGSIDPKNLSVGETLGDGEFGFVYKGIWDAPHGDKVEVAVKTLRDNNNMNKKQFYAEAQIMMNLNHPYIVKLIGICHGPPVAMVQELAQMGSLLDLLLDHPDQINPEFHLKLWSIQVSEGMKYLEEKHFVHRDLAARNLLVSSLTLIKISDFGLSKALDVNRDYYKVTIGGRWPLKWYAPESIYYGTFTHKSDVWSFGVTLWELYTFGDQPYGTLAGAEVIELLEKNERLPCPKNCSKNNYKLMLSCWDFNADCRPSFKELVSIFKSNPEYIAVKSYIK